MMYFVIAGQNNFTPADKSQRLTLEIPELPRHMMRESIEEVFHWVFLLSTSIKKKKKMYLKWRTHSLCGKKY